MEKSWKLDFWRNFKVQKCRNFIIFWHIFGTKWFFSLKISPIYLTRSFIIFRTHKNIKFGTKNSSKSSKLTILFNILQNATYTKKLFFKNHYPLRHVKYSRQISLSMQNLTLIPKHVSHSISDERFRSFSCFWTKEFKIFVFKNMKSAVTSKPFVGYGMWDMFWNQG